LKAYIIYYNTIKKIRLIAVVILFATASNHGFAQKTTATPYSIYGLGEIESSGFATHMGMGDAKVASMTNYQINISNPATYHFLRQPVFEVGLFSNNIVMESNGVKQQNHNTYIRNFAMAVPVSKRTGIAFGLVPFSKMGYNIKNEVPDGSGGLIQYLYEGSGGINRAFMGFGTKLIGTTNNQLGIGLNASYYFGYLNKTRRVVFLENQAPSMYNTRISEQVNVGDFNVDAGMYYRRKIKEEVILNVAASYTVPSNLNARNTSLINTYATVGANNILRDTIFYSSDTSSLRMPQRILLGTSLDIKNKIVLLAEFSMQNWASFRYFNTDQDLRTRLQYSVGAQYLPNYKSVNNLVKSIYYRAGFRYTQTMLNIKNQGVDEFGISFGLGIPFLKSQSMSSLNISVESGSRGFNQSAVINEQFTNIFIGVSLSPHKFDRWFVKRKID
jgi:hypothetical protein